MGRPNSLELISDGLAFLTAVCALLLGLRLSWERRTREADLPVADRKHFLIQDLRRGLGILLMGYLAFGVSVGSRLPTFVLTPKDPGGAGPLDVAAGAVIMPALEAHPNRRFLAIWLAVFASIVLLLALAMIDWISTRRYALRHRREMNRERLEILRQTFRHSRRAEDGLAPDGPDELS
jgi:hypothetical protein